MRGLRSALAGLVAVAVLVVGCTAVSITGSGNVVTQDMDISDFDQVEAGWGLRVTVRQAESYSVVIRADDNVVRYLDVSKQGDRLKIGLKRNVAYSFGAVTLEATVTLPELSGLELSGGSHGEISGFRSNKALSVEASGGSELEGSIEARDTRLNASGGSRVTLSGSGGDLTVESSGGSRVDLATFDVQDANVEASGGGTVTVNASGGLSVDASGGSNVYYVGSPSLGRVDVSGGSQLLPK